jgi:uncharacterized protein with HEPN domain
VLVHLIQVIGEAAAGLSDGFIAEHPKVPWRQIIATNNRVVHGYFEVDLDIVLDVAVIDVPQLASQVLAIQSGRAADLGLCRGSCNGIAEPAAGCAGGGHRWWMAAE